MGVYIRAPAQFYVYPGDGRNRMSDPTNLQQKHQRRPWPNYNAFRPFVMQEFTRRKFTYPTPMNAPFIRMTACTQEPEKGYTYFTLGLHGFGSEDLNIFDVTYGTNREIIGYAYDLNNVKGGIAQKRLIATDELSVSGIPDNLSTAFNDAQRNTIIKEQQRAAQVASGERGDSLPGGAHPIPGINDVVVSRSSPGAPFIATVKWQCYNRAQLEYLRHQFMVVGAHVVIEWGQQFSDRQFTNILEFGDTNKIKTQLADAIMLGRKYVIDTFVEPNTGNYDFLVGTLGQFSIDLDPATGIYQCSTTIYSVGEEMWGLTTDKTFINKTAAIGSPDIANPTTIHDYFLIGSIFDKDIDTNSSNKELVAAYSEAWAKTDTNHTSTNAEYKDFKTNSKDYRFVSWKFITEHMLPRMLALITHPKVKKDIGTFLNLYMSGSSSGSADQEDWIGNNKFLKSTNPDTMVLYRSDAKAPDGFSGAGDFGADPHKAKLNRGVWFNVGMIREAFLTADSMQGGLRTIFSRMNQATVGYWDLSLFFDEEDSRYKIVDNRYGDVIIPAMYKFNVGGQGELLKIEFDSAFPPALISQMAIFASIRARNKPTQAELLKDYPAIGTTGTFIFALNWTNLIDILAPELDQRRGAPSLTIVPADSHVIGATEPDVKSRIGQRVTGDDTTYVTSGMTNVRSAPGTPIGDANIFHGSNVTTPVNVPVVRDSAGPMVYEPTDKKRLTELTIAEVLARQSGKPRQLFAVGKYQWVPVTLRGAVSYTKIDTSRKFDAAAQEELFEAFFIKRPSLGAWYRGSGSRAAAHDSLAHEFAGIPVGKYTETTIRVNGKPVLIKANRNTSAYSGVSGNRSGISAEEVERVLDQRPNKEALKSLISKVESGGSYDAANAGVAGDLGSIGSSKYHAAINNIPVYAATPAVPKPSVPTPTPVATPLSTGINPFTTPPTPSVPPSTTGIAPVSTTTTTTEQTAQEKQNTEQITTRFGSSIIPMVETLPSRMLASITQDGYTNHPQEPNSFVAPFPTETTITLTMLGISGLSIADGFYVDKLPFIFEEYGCFQATQINEHVSSMGWVTSIRGVFRLLNLEAKGAQNPPISELHG